MIRKFEFKNNYLSGDTNSLEAEYSSVGYFDGMDGSTLYKDSFINVSTEILVRDKQMDDCMKKPAFSEIMSRVHYRIPEGGQSCEDC